jgi:small subunit ribosomal protein S1
MLTHDQTQDQDEVKNVTTEETTSVGEEQASTEPTELVENEKQETPADETPVKEEPAQESTPSDEPVQEEQPAPEPEPIPEPKAEAEPIPEPETKPEAEPAAEPEPAPAPKPVKAKTAKPKAAHSADQSEMMQLLEASESNLKKGQIVKGVVVNITEKEVMVDIGYKSEGVISLSEFAYSGMPERNAQINVFISEMEDGEGKLHLSKKRADFILNIQLIKETFEQDKTVPGAIRRRVKGGMIVDVLGIEAFLPGSQMSLKPIPNLDQFIGKEMVFKIVSLDEERRNIILSRKKVLEEEMSSKRNELLSHIEIGAELEGEVKNITQYGAFIDLGGIDGLLHLSDMSWGKINHPSEMLSISDKLKVKVIHYDPETGKISLGLKQLVPHPWEHIEIKYPEGTRVTGKVVSVKSYGAFVEIEPGVEGLVHISEMSWTKKITDARRVLKMNDTVNAIVLELDKENKRISLGMKQMEANPWLTIEDRYPVGTVLTRVVKSLTAFGAFVEIEDGIDGLIHISDISWTKRIYHPKEIYKKNQEVEAIVLSIDRALHRIALGVKQLRSDPWEHLPEKLPVNTEVKGKVSKLIPKGILVDIQIDDYIVEGFVPISHLAIPKLEHSEDAFHLGEELPLKVIELDTENRRLIMSVKAFFFSRDPKLQEEYIVLHEQYIRDRISRLQRKKAEKDARQRDREKNGEELSAPEDDNQEETETGDGTFDGLEEPLEQHLEEQPAPVPVVEETPVPEPVQEIQPEPQTLPVTEEPMEPVAEELPAPVADLPVEPAPKKKAAPRKKVAEEPAVDKPGKTTKVKTTVKEKAAAVKKTAKPKQEKAPKKATAVKKTVKAKKEPADKKATTVKKTVKAKAKTTE